ncbi:PAS domain-containing protein [uncultured Alistipes sp.]|uniref:PAS domain-containing protein n=1 Tax=uncultured Alistipes sp. TaxID=538949 RepID=UPI0025DC85B2|nr:PAS domain-containing protein [uncultured Alistipes sp.]
MSRYDDCSREELIRRIEELEGQSGTDANSQHPFRDRYACKILDSLPDMLTVLDNDGTLVELVSADETNHVGVPGEQLRGKDIHALLSPEAYRNVKKNLDNVFASGRGSSSHHDITLGGNTRNYENRIMPLDDGHALCICRDITEAEAAKHELEMVKYALNNVDEEIYACDLDGTMEYANEQFRVRHEVEGGLAQYKVYDFWSFKGTRRQWEERLAKIRRDNGSHKYTVRFKNELGRIVAWDIVSYIIYDHFKQREIVWFFGRDVTQRLEHENKVKEMNSILDSILNNIPVYLFVKDPGNEFRYLYWNRAFEEFSQIPASKALGHTDYEVFPSPKDAEHFRQDDLTLLRTGERMTFIEEYVAASGETRIVSTTKSLVPVENRLPLIIGVSWDITDMKNAELEVVEARIRAEESDRLKSAFLANMSHEIRTPLNAIVGFAKLIGEAETEEEKQQFTEIIDTNSDLLLQLINDILDISKIEAGTLEFHFRPMNLNDLCRSELEVHKSRVKPGVNLVFDERIENVEIVCDQNRLAQVISNLLNNAGKFTDEGEIRFGFDLRDGRIEFFVQDTGVGIPADKVRDVFDRFVKLNDFAAGTGLGLAISKMIVEKLDGTIGVESEQGKGTRFYFSIPVLHRDDTEGDACASATGEAGKSWTLLVAEDSDINYKLVEAVLNLRFNLVRARTGGDAVELFEKVRPDAVLMDIRMPVMDGLEAARRIRRIAPEVPIIAMSAYSFGNEIENARNAGCNEFLVKPLSQYSLHKALNACLVDLKDKA